ncbi:MAG: hypothetical protein AAFW97_14635 [Pseudomonadota bacterium]
MSDIYKFEQLLRRAAELEAEVRIVPMINQHYGDVEFYAHIEGHDSDTVDISICKRSAFLQLNRGADGLKGELAREINKKAASPSPLT